MIRLLRWILAGVCFGAALYWLVEWWTRPRVELGFEADTGRPTGLRISPLGPLEAAIARELERDYPLTPPPPRAHDGTTVTARPGPERQD